MWHDKWQVNMLSTIQQGKLVDSRKIDPNTKQPIKKPDAILDYNINMQLVDKSDMQVGTVDCLRKCCKCYKKTFLHIMDLCLLNAYNLYIT